MGSLIMDKNKIWYNGSIYNRFLGYTKHVKSLKSGTKINCLTGMGTLIPIEIVEKLNYWDNVLFPQYYGDTDFTLKAYKLGIKLFINSQMIIYNKTEYSSYNQTFVLKNYLKSLTLIQSRYNINIESKFHKKHCETQLWRLTMIIKHGLYLVKNIVNSMKNFASQ
jgi:GT2 family glycosyltransferase